MTPFDTSVSHAKLTLSDRSGKPTSETPLDTVNRIVPGGADDLLTFPPLVAL